MTRDAVSSGGQHRVVADTFTTMHDSGVGLIGDIGATNARFALVQPGGGTTTARVYALTDYGSLSEAIDAYLTAESPSVRPAQAVRRMSCSIIGRRGMRR